MHHFSSAYFQFHNVKLKHINKPPPHKKKLSICCSGLQKRSTKSYLFNMISSMEIKIGMFHLILRWTRSTSLISMNVIECRLQTALHSLHQTEAQCVQECTEEVADREWTGGGMKGGDEEWWSEWAAEIYCRLSWEQRKNRLKCSREIWCGKTGKTAGDEELEALKQKTKERQKMSNSLHLKFY